MYKQARVRQLQSPLSQIILLLQVDFQQVTFPFQVEQLVQLQQVPQVELAILRH